ncbi:hypothetical protein [Flexivirga meconopsidis]|uniref:hypothetical protein n=1 Tax=Flexivirga meconopsidis TaxID=2977121 RepID=UPI002240C226|nr:hypothetical protein [Flexivirga meconopsidis]
MSLKLRLARGLIADVVLVVIITTVACVKAGSTGRDLMQDFLAYAATAFAAWLGYCVLATVFARMLRIPPELPAVYWLLWVVSWVLLLLLLMASFSTSLGSDDLRTLALGAMLLALYASTIAGIFHAIDAARNVQ